MPTVAWRISLVHKHTLGWEVTKNEGGEPFVLDQYEVPVTRWSASAGLY